MLVAAVSLAIFAGFYPPAVDTVQGDADMRVLYWQLKLGRETAINQRRGEIPAGETIISTATLEHRAQFLLYPAQPDTPDNFGRPQAVWFGGAASIRFTADGMLTDAAGNPVNGTVFMGQPGRPLTSRAITIFGATATIRSYRWNGSAWRR
jgi:hypothetical protein